MGEGSTRVADRIGRRNARDFSYPPPFGAASVRNGWQPPEVAFENGFVEQGLELQARHGLLDELVDSRLGVGGAHKVRASESRHQDAHGLRPVFPREREDVDPRYGTHPVVTDDAVEVTCAKDVDRLLAAPRLRDVDPAREWPALEEASAHHPHRVIIVHDQQANRRQLLLSSVLIRFTRSNPLRTSDKTRAHKPVQSACGSTSPARVRCRFIATTRATRYISCRCPAPTRTCEGAGWPSAAIPALRGSEA